jgi:ribosomal protein S12 methylthiotransferase accessory factor
VDTLWVRGTSSSTGEPVSLPATAALVGEDVRLGLGPVLSSSTGAAVRDTPEAATRHAVMELVERDAVAIWWYNRLTAPRIAQSIVDAGLPDDLRRWLRGRRRITWHLLIPHDLPATTVVALSARADGSRPAIGAAAAIDPAAAIRSATLELLQGEIALTQMRQAQTSESPPTRPDLLVWSDGVNALAEPELTGLGETAPGQAVTFDTLLGAMAAQGIEVYTADLTRPELGVPVIRALSPQLRDWLPRFAPGRLYDVPVALGLKEEPTAEADLNPVPFVI